MTLGQDLRERKEGGRKRGSDHLGKRLPLEGRMRLEPEAELQDSRSRKKPGWKEGNEPRPLSA
jgi:hypothetical protein